MQHSDAKSVLVAALRLPGQVLQSKFTEEQLRKLLRPARARYVCFGSEETDLSKRSSHPKRLSKTSQKILSEHSEYDKVIVDIDMILYDNLYVILFC